MDPERWPDQIAGTVEKITCPACGAPRSRVMVTVRYLPPIWHLIVNCASCNQMHDSQIIDMFGQLKPKPEQIPEPESVPLPAWVRNIK